LFVFGIAHEKAQREGWAIWFGMCRAVYVMPENLVARLGAAICGRGNSLRNFNSTCSIVSLEPKRGFVHLGWPFDCAARRCARFGLVSCIVFPFAVVAVLPVIEPRCAALLQAILSV
jgi:hypothetical protein